MLPSIDDIYQYTRKQIVNELNFTSVLEVEKVGYLGGFKIYLKGNEFPLKGSPTIEATLAINQVKKIFLHVIKTFGIFIFFINRNKLVKMFNIICFEPINLYLLKREYQQPFTKAFSDFVYLILIGMKIDMTEAIKLADIIGHVFEYDGAYRLRLQDLFSESSKEKLMESPYKETKRLLTLNRTRDSKEVSNKFKVFSLFLVILLIPKYKRIFIKAIKAIDYDNLCYDEADRFWAMQRVDYMAFGKTLEERKEMLKGYKYKEAIAYNKNE